ncbi:unnamed protein product [Lymnaea stagnalis]|uniref:G-protein coupled receptors family 1 profile domain-containing protein n=1 Tax=Lymnaea stagnalis TaxID=6523 RepID=A0AAV2HDI1_LYMST
MAMMTVNYTVIIHHLQCSRVAHSGSMNMSAVQRRSARRVVKMLFTLLVTFMVCSLPFQVTTMYEIYKERTTKLASWYQPVHFTSVTLMVAHSSINPILYGAMNQTFQNGFRQLLDRIRCHHKKAWESQLNIAESLKPCVSLVNNGQLDLTISTAVAELFHTSSKLGTVVVGRK